MKGEHHGSSFLLQQTSAGLFAGSDWSQQTVLQSSFTLRAWDHVNLCTAFHPTGGEREGSCLITDRSLTS